jgi:hypothetical protein
VGQHKIAEQFSDVVVSVSSPGGRVGRRCKNANYLSSKNFKLKYLQSIRCGSERFEVEM